MDLGVFSISLAVKDISASKAFYEKFGFTVIDGNIEENWLILKNENTVIGIFQDMFEENILTFHPSDVRAIQKELKAQGIEFTLEADENTEGPAHAALVDPDGNQILMDQF
jgi:lactoylglutathione lyase